MTGPSLFVPRRLYAAMVGSSFDCSLYTVPSMIALFHTPMHTHALSLCVCVFVGVLHNIFHKHLHTSVPTAKSPQSQVSPRTTTISPS